MKMKNIHVIIVAVTDCVGNFCTIPRSSREILERIGVSNHSKNKDKYIKSLIDSGYLEMTNPANPNASNQKYRKKAKK